jgi:hypothetical protein
VADDLRLSWEAMGKKRIKAPYLNRLASNEAFVSIGIVRVRLSVIRSEHLLSPGLHWSYHSNLIDEQMVKRFDFPPTKEVLLPKL